MSSDSKKCSPTSSSNTPQTTTNVTIDQMIEHMTADLQGSTDGQYIQLGFTPHQTTQQPSPTESTTWPEYQNNGMFTRINYPSPSFPPGFNNFMPTNQVYLSNDPTTKLEHPVHFTNQNPGYILYNQMAAPPPQPQTQELPPHFIQRDFGMFDQNSQIFIENPYNPYQNTPSKQTFSTPQPPSSGTHLIENLVGNWTPNTSGTYSPFGNAVHDTPKVEINIQTDEIPPLHNVTNRPTTQSGVKKPRMVAEVKPMRLRYSDVLAKSVPPNNGGTVTPKSTKFDVKENISKSKTQQSSKKSTPSKTASLKSQLQCPLQNRNDLSGVRNDEYIINHSSSSPYHKNSSKLSSSNNWATLSTEDSDVDSEKFTNTTARGKSETKSFARSSDTKLKNNESTHHRAQKIQNNFNFEYRGESISPGNNNNNNNTSGGDPNIRNIEKSFTTAKNTKKSKDMKTPGGKFGTSYGVGDKPPMSGRRGQRYRKRDNTNSTLGLLQRSIKQYLQRWSALALCVIIWLLHLISDVCSLSIHLSKDLCTNSWSTLKEQAGNVSKTTVALFSKIQIFAKIIKYIDDHVGHKWFAFWNRGKNKDTKNNVDSSKTWHTSGLDTNIPMPSTGEEAMKRLLACKGKDPYSILGVTPDCTDDDIKRYYKRQAFLVHPDKNPQPGAEEAFKILVHAFDIIGEPERRQSYDRKVAESHQVEQAWSELNDLLSQLHQKMEYAANTIRCTNCTKRHRRIHVERPCYAARMCAQCKIHHSAKEGDIWAESQCFGFLWYYYACMDGAVYDITEWASCQRANLRHLRPNTHQVQYRIVLGKQTTNGCGGGGSNSPTSASTSPSGLSGGGSSHNTSSPLGHGRSRGGPKLDREPDLEDLEEFLNNLYQKTGGATGSGTNTSGTSGGGVPSSTSSTQSPNDPSSGGGGSGGCGLNRQDTTRNRKKNKRKK